MGTQRPKTGVGVMILNEKGEVLLGKRKSPLGRGEYSFPGGHLEHLESFAECARRETKEETGIEIQNVRFQCLANVTAYAPKHYVHIGLIAEHAEGEPEVREPDKFESWDWYPLTKLPEPIFLMSKLAFDSHKDGTNYYDVPNVG